ncbi:MAG: glycoside hydrolase family 3 C-terminal domain-containing protein [Phycisphaerales bacterium]
MKKNTIRKIISVLFGINLMVLNSYGINEQTSNVEQKAKSLLSQMTLEEKIDYIVGYNDFYIRPMQRLGIPEIKMSDGPVGCRTFGKTTAYPATIGLAASWNRQLAVQFGNSIGKDARARGVHILLMPGVNIYRSPLCGRNFEYMGEDPYLVSEISGSVIKGVQSEQVMATIKHYMGNNQEYDRHHISSDMDERTMHEIYLEAFRHAVQDSKVCAVMTSYNLINGIHASQNDYLINKVLKGQWGFDGFVMSDWGSTYDGVAAAKAGLDIEMPNGKFMNKENLLPAIKAGQISEAEINDKVLRILRMIIKMGFLDRPQKDETIPLDNPASAKVALQMAREGIVLLKNNENILPLNPDKIKSIAVIGANATMKTGSHGGGGSSYTETFKVINSVEAVKELAAGKFEVVNFEDANVSDSANIEAMKKADAVLVCAGFNPSTEHEGGDRSYELPPEQIAIIKKASELNKNTIVAVTAGGSFATKGWLDNVNVLIHNWYPGQNGTTALAEIIFGKVNPSGKLPITFEKQLEDLPAFNYYHDEDGDKHIKYTEGIFAGYRGFEKAKTKPLFSFGHGLSYTKFEYSNLKISPTVMDNNENITISADIKNSGNMEGTEIVQLYITDVNCSVERPAKELKGFEKVTLSAGETKTIHIDISKEQISFYSVEKHQWIAEPGEFKVSLGSSSEDIRLQSKFILKL